MRNWRFVTGDWWGDGRETRRGDGARRFEGKKIPVIFLPQNVLAHRWDRAHPEKELGNPVEFTICVGINTSHGNIREAREIEDYLQIGKRHGVQGASIFTWETLQPYLPEVKKAGYLEKFAAGLRGAQSR